MLSKAKEQFAKYNTQNVNKLYSAQEAHSNLDFGALSKTFFKNFCTTFSYLVHF